MESPAFRRGEEVKEAIRKRHGEVTYIHGCAIPSTLASPGTRKPRYGRCCRFSPGTTTGSNDTLGLIKWEQMVFLGNPEYGVNMAGMDFVKFAEACGARGLRIEDPERCRDQLAEALRWDGPAIIECAVDQHEPPIPAKVQKGQMENLTEALRRGTPNRNRIALQMVKDMLDESSFQASPGRRIPDAVGRAAKGLRGKKQE